MDRNFHQRVELLYPIENKSLKELVIRHLDYQLKDNQLSWALEAGSRQKQPGAFIAHTHHGIIYSYFTAALFFSFF